MSVDFYRAVLPRFINGVSGDPGTFCLFPLSGQAVLLDAGDLSALSSKDILRIQHIAISHTHIDHFIGFDRILRVHIPHFRPLHLYGPKGLTDNVLGKLQGYMWNLIQPQQLNFMVSEVSEDGSWQRFAITSNDGKFAVELLQEKQLGFVALDEALSVKLLPLDHGTISCGFYFRLERKSTVNVAAVDALGLKPGAWIAKVQEQRLTADHDADISIDGRNFKIAELAKAILIANRPLSFLYITDLIFSESNLLLLQNAISAVDLVIAESCFRDADRSRAFAKKHLTTRQAALLACAVGAEALSTFHYSQIYPPQEIEEHTAEAGDFFQRFKALSAAEFKEQLDSELLLSQAYVSKS